MNPPVFQPYGVAHLVVLGLTVGLPVLFWATAREPGRESYRRGIRYGLAALLAVNWIAYEVNRAAVGQFTAAHALPMQLCDWAMFAVIWALLACRPGVYEAAYFWGLAGTLQAILTPSLKQGWPSWWFACFFVAHCGIVVSVLYLTAVEGLRPRAGSLPRAMLWSEIYLAAALFVNWLTGANYGFLSHKPEEKSLLDALSGNPLVYLLQLNGLALVFYLALYLPFFTRDLIKSMNPREADSTRN